MEFHLIYVAMLLALIVQICKIKSKILPYKIVAKKYIENIFIPTNCCPTIPPKKIDIKKDNKDSKKIKLFRYSIILRFIYLNIFVFNISFLKLLFFFWSSLKLLWFFWSSLKLLCLEFLSRYHFLVIPIFNFFDIIRLIIFSYLF